MEVLLELGMGAVVIAFDGGLFQGTVHPFDLTIGPGVMGLRQAVFDAVPLTALIEHVPDKACG